MIALLDRNDQQSFGALYEYYAPLLFGIVKSIIEDKGNAETVLQQCFGEIWARRRGFDPAKESLFTWMYKITKDIAVRSRVSAPDITADAQKEPDGKLALELIMIHGLSYQEAAAKLNVSVETLKFKIRSALQKTPQTSVRQ